MLSFPLSLVKLKPVLKSIIGLCELSVYFCDLAKIARTADTPCSERSRNVFQASVFGTFREHLGHPINYQMC